MIGPLFSCVRRPIVHRPEATETTELLRERRKKTLLVCSGMREILVCSGMLKTEILAASVRNIEHVKKAALYGADIATLPPQVVSELANHPLTDKGLKAFLDDWNDSGQKIL